MMTRLVLQRLKRRWRTFPGDDRNGALWVGLRYHEIINRRSWYATVWVYPLTGQPFEIGRGYRSVASALREALRWRPADHAIDRRAADLADAYGTTLEEAVDALRRTLGK